MRGQRQTSGNLALEENNVIVIEAAQRPETQKLRVAAYCRVSSDSSDQMNSFAAQMNYYTTLISGKANWTLVDLYADAGISGTSAKKRPDFQRLLSDCRKGRIDKVLVKSISRFARNTMDCLKTIRELKAIGVGVCFEEQNIDTSNMTGELLTAAFSAIAQKESESISQNIRWSYQRRMESGTFLPPSVPFGYRIEDHEIVVNEKQADTIRRIFRNYLAGQSMDKIVSLLNRENPSGEKRKWNISAISYILTNERYTGDSLWQKTYATDTLPTRQVRNHGEREQYFAEATHAPCFLGFKVRLWVGGVLPYLYPPKGAGLLNRGGSWEPTPFPGRGWGSPPARPAGGSSPEPPGGCTGPSGSGIGSGPPPAEPPPPRGRSFAGS